MRQVILKCVHPFFLVENDIHDNYHNKHRLQAHKSIVKYGKHFINLPGIKNEARAEHMRQMDCATELRRMADGWPTWNAGVSHIAKHTSDCFTAVNINGLGNSKMNVIFRISNFHWDPFEI